MPDRVYRRPISRNAVDAVVADRTRVSLSPADGVDLHVRVGEEVIAYSVEQLRLDGVDCSPGHIIPAGTFVAVSVEFKRDDVAPISLAGIVERARPLLSVRFEGNAVYDRERLASVVSRLAADREDRTDVTRIIRDAPEPERAGVVLEELRAQVSQLVFEKDELRRELDDFRREAKAMIRMLQKQVIERSRAEVDDDKPALDELSHEAAAVWSTLSGEG